MLNILEKLLDVYCNYNFMNSGQNFQTHGCIKSQGGLTSLGLLAVSCMLGSLCLELGGGRSRQVPSQGTWQAGHTVGIQGSAHDTQGALPAGLLQPWFRGAGEPGLGHSVLGGLVWPSGAAIWLQSGPLLAVVPPSHASSNEQLCAPHRVFLCYAFICCAPEPCSLPRVPSGLSSP